MIENLVLVIPFFGGSPAPVLIAAPFILVTFLASPYTPIPGIRAMLGARANYTDARALGLPLGAQDGKAIVVEGYTLEKQDGSMKFTVDGSDVGWRWVMENPDWGWAREEERREEIRRQDAGFLEEHGDEYVNVTEEIWAGRTVDPGEVKGG